MEIRKKLKLLVFGIDGASAGVMRSLMERGDLPAFRALRARSASGPLQSTFPPHTAPGWASMFTGVSPGEHGIFQFWATKTPDYSARAMNVADYAREPCWLTLERHGLSVGVYNVPMTHPPAPLRDGYMISWPLARTLHYTSPPELRQELVAAGLHYHSDIVTMYRGQPDYCEQAQRFIEARSQTCLYLQRTRPVDALFVVFTEIDRVSHYYWGDGVEPASEVEQCYRDVDRALATVLELTDEHTLVVVASDHGFGRCDADFNVHELLAQRRLLATRFIPVDAAGRRPREDTTADSWFEAPTAYKRVIDWSRTRFYMPTPGCFGLNANLKGREEQGILDEEDLGVAEECLRAAMASITGEDGKPWFEVVRSDTVYSGACLTRAPDYLLIPRDFSVMPTPHLTEQTWSEPTQRGVHRPDGILYLAGAGIPRGVSLFARIEDVAPTLLAHLGLPVPDHLDGHFVVEPPTEVKRETAHTHRAGRRMSSEESAFMDRQLRQIGYF